MRIELPKLCLVALVGPSGSGKSTFARQHFAPTEVLESDFFRGLVCDDATNQESSADAFDALYTVAQKRLARGLLTVLDATHLDKKSRAKVRDMAREHDCPAVALVFATPLGTCLARNEARPDRQLPPARVRTQFDAMKNITARLKQEGFRHIHVLEADAAAEIVRQPLWNDKRGEHGPFDIIGDVHGCYDELCALLEHMGWTVNRQAHAAVPPQGRKAVFLGDLCDRGPRNADVLRLVMNMHAAGTALCVPGNHDVKLQRWLEGGKPNPKYGFDVTMAELEAAGPEFRAEVQAFLRGLVSHYVLDDGKLVVAHAGLKEALQGRASGRVREFCLWGEVTGETDEYGLPVRVNWAEEYRGRALVVFGHQPCTEPLRVNNTVDIDTGCAFGGRLTALRYPEQELTSVPAAREYYASLRPLLAAKDTKALPDIRDVLGKRRIATRLQGILVVPEENNAAALETMSRWAIDPRWLIYLPPTMSPAQPSARPDYLEYPDEAFAYYRAAGVGRLVCEEKHMGSRAVMTLCRDEAAAQRRFGARDGTLGVVHTRTGRRFFEDPALEAQVLARARAALGSSGFWAAQNTDWVCLDCEMLPWSAKAQQLIADHYAPVGVAGRAGLAAAAEALQQAAARIAGPVEGDNAFDPGEAAARFAARKDCLDRYVRAYQGYCWPVQGVDDLRVAPFHVLATEGHVWTDKTHLEHLAAIRQYLTADPLFIATNHKEVDTNDAAQCASAGAWWEELTSRGGEGMVVKPLEYIPTGTRRFVQPALKCRGREYLRIIYGPEYTQDLEQLKQRSNSAKMRMAMREFALGIEALERFVHNKPLYAWHECVFAVLALESDPVDPRL